jgi:hypothetical protein
MIGSLSIAGRDGNMSMHNRNHKFKFLKQTIDMNDLGLLGIQETHFDAESATQFNNVFGRWFKLYYSAHPEKPCSTDYDRWQSFVLCTSAGPSLSDSTPPGFTRWYVNYFLATYPPILLG